LNLPELRPLTQNQLITFQHYRPIRICANPGFAGLHFLEILSG